MSGRSFPIQTRRPLATCWWRRRQRPPTRSAPPSRSSPTNSASSARPWSRSIAGPSAPPPCRCTMMAAGAGARPNTTPCKPCNRPHEQMCDPRVAQGRAPALLKRPGDPMHGGARQAAAAEPKRLIEVTEEDYVIEHHFEDWLAFSLFWALAGIVFLQFFTRYVLNDSLAWTEEIARYGLMALTFLGGAVVTRRNTQIAVALLPNLLPPAYGRALLASVDLLTLGFLALLAYFSVLIAERMQFQRMTVFDLPMSLVYGAVAVGCFLMLGRQALKVWRHASDGWRSAYAVLAAPFETAGTPP